MAKAAKGDIYLSFSKTKYPHEIEEKTKKQLEKQFRQSDPNFLEAVHYKDGKLFQVKVGASGIKEPEQELMLDKSYSFYLEMQKYLEKKGIPLI